MDDGDIPELTKGQWRDLDAAGFGRDRFERLCRTAYGRTLARSVLRCLVDETKDAPTPADLWRADEARRMVSTLSGAEFRAVLAARGVIVGPPGEEDARPPGRVARWTRRSSAGRTQARKAADTQLPGTRRMLAGWALVALLAFGCCGFAAVEDYGLGVVAGLLALAVAQPLLYRRVIRAGHPVRPLLSGLFAGSWLLLITGGFFAPDLYLYVFGSEGTGSVDHEWTRTGSHHTTYLECEFRLPNGDTATTRSPGACPAPVHSAITLVHDPTGLSRPMIGPKSDLDPWAAALPYAAGIAGLTIVAAGTRRAA